MHEPAGNRWRAHLIDAADIRLMRETIVATWFFTAAVAMIVFFTVDTYRMRQENACFQDRACRNTIIDAAVEKAISRAFDKPGS